MPSTESTKAVTYEVVVKLSVGAWPGRASRAQILDGIKERAGRLAESYDAETAWWITSATPYYENVGDQIQSEQDRRAPVETPDA